MPSSQVLPGIEHIILLMFENRSFDNVLGGFFPSTPDGGGVPQGWSNPSGDLGSGNIAAWSDPTTNAQTAPNPDPQEGFGDMNEQIFTNPPMNGFVMNYATVEGSNPADVMQYYSQTNMPVTYALSQAYAVSDRYFASAPVQTWGNRLFSLCGTPGFDAVTNIAYLNNTDYPSYPDTVLDMKCIFQQIDEESNGQTWKVYYDDEMPISSIIDYIDTNWDDSVGNVCAFQDGSSGDFFNDIINNTLPNFSLIEPRYQMLSASGLQAPNSNHPGASTVTGDGPAISVSCGENMLANIYNALKQNQTLFAKTLLIVTYDEHGGLFDHVTPPSALSPFNAPVSNFQYNVYGVRVPAIFINPYVNTGIFRPLTGNAFDHTSLLATLKAQFNLNSSLSPRVDVAVTFEGLINQQNAPIPDVSIEPPQCIGRET